MRLPYDCQYPLRWVTVIPFRAHDAVDDLLAYFKQDIKNNIQRNWYTFAKFDEYARQARVAIAEVSRRSFTSEFLLGFVWRSLSTCEKNSIKYQEIINHLGNNMQCALSATSIDTPSTSFFMNLMPNFAAGTNTPFTEYVNSYYTGHLPIKTREQLDRQVKCVSPIAGQPPSQSHHPPANPAQPKELHSAELDEDLDSLHSSLSNTDQKSVDLINKIDRKATKLMKSYQKKMRTVSMAAGITDILPPLITAIQSALIELCLFLSLVERIMERLSYIC